MAVMSRRQLMFARMKRAALLDVDTYEEVEADSTATGQAAAVVALASIAHGIGTAGEGGPGLLVGLAATLLAWGVWALVTYLIGQKLFGGTATWGELLRTLGFAQSPGLLAIFGLIPVVGVLIRAVVVVWVLITGIIAIRQALDFSTGRAILTAVIGWLALAIPMTLLGIGG